MYEVHHWVQFYFYEIKFETKMDIFFAFYVIDSEHRIFHKHLSVDLQRVTIKYD